MSIQTKDPKGQETLGQREILCLQMWLDIFYSVTAHLLIFDIHIQHPCTHTHIHNQNPRWYLPIVRHSTEEL